MDINEALAAFGALSQDTRLRVFRLLVEHGPSGAPAGTLSESLNIPHNTLSFHLSHMSHAGLVVSRREGRSIIYRANFEFFSPNADGEKIMTDNVYKALRPMLAR